MMPALLKIRVNSLAVEALMIFSSASASPLSAGGDAIFSVISCWLFVGDCKGLIWSR